MVTLLLITINILILQFKKIITTAFFDPFWRLALHEDIQTDDLTTAYFTQANR